MRESKSKLFKDRLRSLVRSKNPERNTAEATGAGPPLEPPQSENSTSPDTTNVGPVEAINDPPSPAVPEEPTTSSISFRLWNEAYDSIKEKQSELVETYEKILSQQIAEGMPYRVARTGIIN